MQSRSNQETVNLPSNKKFIAINILPPRDEEDYQKTIDTLKSQIEKAMQLGFNYAWLNPINTIPDNTACHRRCFDTGVMTTFYQSLYAPNNLLEIRNLFSSQKEKIKEIIEQAKKRGFSLLIDFVWKHVSINSNLIHKHPSWFKPTNIKDIKEYDFSNHSTYADILSYHHKAIDLYLNPNTGFGFSGLRIDAASHISPEVRSELYTYIRNHYPDAIIFEEVLFDSNAADNVTNLAHEADQLHLYSDFVTSNIYYQKPDAFGSLPLPELMGDTQKLKLAQGHGIGFTGNHDHFSIGWATILSMAATRVYNDKDYQDILRSITSTPMRSEVLHHATLFHTIENIATQQKTIEGLSQEEEVCLRYLLPFANEIAHELLDYNKYPETLQKFKKIMFEKVVNRTLTPAAGYFFLNCELDSFLETQRIFANQQGLTFDRVLLCAHDLISETNKNATYSILEEMAKEKSGDHKKYDNLLCFSKQIPLPVSNEKKNNGKNHKKQIPLPGRKEKKNNGENHKKAKQKGSVQKDNSLHHARIWLPYIIEYLRNHPEKIALFGDKLNPSRIKSEERKVLDAIGWTNFIKQTNTIYTGLSADCSNYATFTSLDNYKIIVRCLENSTDVIVVNLNPDRQQSMNSVDMEKIALWFQARLFPLNEAYGDQSKVQLSNPFESSQEVKYCDLHYSSYWKNKVGQAFDDAYQRILGLKEGHQTNLFIGLGIHADVTNEYPKIRVIDHIKTEQEHQSDIFHAQRKTTLVGPAVTVFPSQVKSTLFNTLTTEKGSTITNSPPASSSAPTVTK